MWVGERPQSQTKNYSQLRNAKSRRNSYPKERAGKLVIQCQIVSHENIHTINIIQSEQVKFGIYMCIHMHIITMKKRP